MLRKAYSVIPYSRDIFFTTHNFGVVAWDMSNPHDIQPVNQFEVGQSRGRLINGILFMWRRTPVEPGGITLLDVQNAHDMRQIAFIDFKKNISSLTVSADGRMFALTAEGIVEIDVHGNQKVRVSMWDYNFLHPTCEPSDIIIFGDLLAVTGRKAGVAIFRMTPDGRLSLQRHIPFTNGTSPSSLHVIPNRQLLVVGKTESLFLIDAKTPTKAKRLKAAKYKNLTFCEHFLQLGNKILAFGVNHSGAPICCMAEISDSGLTPTDRIPLTDWKMKNKKNDVPLGLLQKNNTVLVFTSERGLGIFDME
ncbi:MAG: hypothetical protein LBR06_01645 [Bacteroidales bacterium]|nr:hypothetical protein [Bacteroidales bacterium]